MIYLDLDDALYIAERAIGAVDVRDVGLLEAALSRPQTTIGGRDAYADIYLKAGALVHSIVQNHSLVDGNKRLGLACLVAFLGLNGLRLELSNDEAYDLIMDVAAGRLATPEQIAGRIATAAWR